MKLRWILVALALAFASPATAGHKYGRQVRFAGIHPVPKAEGGGICYIEYPHVHIYTPNKLEYRTIDDDNVFVGDPVAYGWDGPKHAYKGHHPIQVNVVAGVGEPTTTWCYINGPHYHSFEPPESPEFRMVGDAYFYVGTPPPAYLEARPQYIGINAVYEPIVYTRPVVTVEPPSLWIGVRPEYTWVQPAVVVEQPGRHLGHPGGVVVGGGAFVGGGAVIGGGVQVAVPMPSVSVGVQIGGPAVIMAPGGGGHGKFKEHGKFKGRR